MQIEKVPVGSLVLDPTNARKHDQKNLEAIKGSLAKFGQQKPIVVTADNVVIAGNGTLEAAKALGWEKIDIHRTVLKGAEAMAYALADNQSGALASWDEDILKEQIGALSADGWDVGDIGFDLDDFDFSEKTEGNTDPEDVPEIEKNKFHVEPGQLWELGRHRLLCGDSTKIEEVTRLMEGKTADMIFTDPPYNVAYEGSDGQSIQNDKMNEEEFSNFCARFYASMFEILGVGCPIYVFHSDSMRHIFTQQFKNAGFKFSGNLVWNKNSLNMGRFDYHMKHEPCLYGWKPGGKHRWYGDRKQTTVIDFDKPRANDLHPTMKPVGLIEYFLANSSMTGDTVVDLFLGSGSTLMACETTGRVCYGTELDPHYCSVILERWQNFTGKEATRLG